MIPKHIRSRIERALKKVHSYKNGFDLLNALYEEDECAKNYADSYTHQTKKERWFSINYDEFIITGPMNDTSKARVYIN